VSIPLLVRMDRAPVRHPRAIWAVCLTAIISLCAVASSQRYRQDVILRSPKIQQTANSMRVVPTVRQLRHQRNLPTRVHARSDDELVKELQANIAQREAEMKKLRADASRSKQGSGGPLQLASLVVTPVSIAVGLRGYLEANKARRELAQKKNEIRAQQAEYSQRLAEARRELEAQKVRKVKIPVPELSESSGPVSRRVLFPVAAAGVLAIGTRLGQITAGGKPEEIAKLESKRIAAEKAKAEQDAILASSRAELQKAKERAESLARQESKLREDLSQTKLFSAKEIENLQEKIDEMERTPPKTVVVETTAESMPADPGLSLQDARVKTLLAASTGSALALGVLGFNTKQEAAQEKERLETRYETDMSKARDELELTRETAAQKEAEQEKVASDLRDQVAGQTKKASELRSTLEVQQNRARELQKTIDLLRDSEKRTKEGLANMEKARDSAEARGEDLRAEVQALNHALAEAQGAIKDEQTKSAKAADQAAARERELEAMISTLRSEISDWTAKDAASQSELEQKKTLLEQTEAELVTVKAEKAKAEAEAAEVIKAEQKRVSELTARSEDLVAELTKWQTDYAALKKNSEQNTAELEERITSLQTELSDAANNLEGTRNELGETQSALEETRKLLGDKENVLGGTREELEAKILELKQTESKLHDVEEELSKERGETAGLAKKVSELRVSLESQEELTAGYNEQLQTLTDVLEKTKSSLNQVEEEANEQVKASKMESDALRSTVSLLEREREELKEASEVVQAEKSKIEAELESLRTESGANIQRLQGAYDDLTKDLAAAEVSGDRLKAAKAQLKELEKELKETVEQKKAAEALEARLAEAETKHAQELEDLRNSLSTRNEQEAAGEAQIQLEKVKSEYEEKVAKLESELMELRSKMDKSPTKAKKKMESPSDSPPTSAKVKKTRDETEHTVVKETVGVSSNAQDGPVLKSPPRRPKQG